MVANKIFLSETKNVNIRDAKKIFGVLIRVGCYEIILRIGVVYARNKI
jgi:hypothetical protein